MNFSIGISANRLMRKSDGLTSDLLNSILTVLDSCSKLLMYGTSRDRGFCPGTFAPALVPGQRDNGTRKIFCPGTKGQRDVPSRGNPSCHLIFSPPRSFLEFLQIVFCPTEFQGVVLFMGSISASNIRS